MGITQTPEHFFSRRFSASFAELEVPMDKRGKFILKFAELMRDIDPPLLPNLYDLKKTIERYARRKHLEFEKALDIVLKNPIIVCRINKVEIKNDLKFHDTLTFAEIRKSAIETTEAENRRPTVDSGMILYGPLKNKLSWNAVHIALAQGYHGLEKGKFRGLPDFLNKKGIEGVVENLGGRRSPYLSLKDIEESLLTTYKAEKFRPHCHSGLVKYGPLKDKETFGTLDDAIKHKTRGLDDCKDASLSGLAERLKIPANPHHASSLVSRTKKMRFSLEDAEESFNAHIMHDQKIPTADKTLVQFGPLKRLKITFAAVNVSIGRQEDIHGYSGMKALIEDRCAETAFWYAPNTKLAKEFISNAGVNYDLARHVAALDVGKMFMGPPAWLFQKHKTEETQHAPALAHGMK